jgi:serine/threonine protein kinase
MIEDLHQKGLIHCDIKPDNILFGVNIILNKLTNDAIAHVFDHNNPLYLIDYGLA